MQPPPKLARDPESAIRLHPTANARSRDLETSVYHPMTWCDTPDTENTHRTTYPHTWENHPHQGVKRQRDLRRDKTKFTKNCIDSLFPGTTWVTFNASLDNPTPCGFFTNIIIHHKAHIEPPTKLWTRCHISQLQLNVGRPLPVFFQSSDTRYLFQFIGCYCITDWKLPTLDDEVMQSFVRDYLPYHPERPEHNSISDGWASVVLEKVECPILSARPHHRYLMHYVFKIMAENYHHLSPMP